MLIVMTTTSSIEEAEILAEQIVKAKHAACVQIIPKIRSFFYWDEAVTREEEFLLLIKTLDANFDDLKDFIHANHSYSVPEVVAIEAARISDGYADWMNQYLAG